MRTLTALSLLFLALAPAGAAERPFLDLDFESAECSSGWWIGGVADGYTLAIDGTQAYSGRQSRVLRYVGPTLPEGGALGTEFPAAEAAGHHLRLSAWIRTEGISQGRAGLWLRGDDKTGAVIAYAGSGNRGPAGTLGWARYEIAADIPAKARTVVLGGYLDGDGAAWFDHLEVEIDGQPWIEGGPDFSPPGAPALTWLRRNALRFDTVEPGSGTADLRKLRKMIGKARIVSLGEATHGTHEFFRMKHRLFEYLVREMGFTLFGIEANLPETQRMNDYVLTGQGDPREILQGMYFWTWNTQEVLDLAEWMRAYNREQESRSRPGRVQFLGFDMQFAHVAADIVRDFLAAADPTYLREANVALNRAVAVEKQRLATGADELLLQNLVAHMEQHRGDYLARFPATDVEWAVRNARVALQCVQDTLGTVSRDVSMAENVGWLLDQNPGEKIVLWAHNEHVSKRPGWMGSFLAQRFGPDVVSLGFAFREGSYNAIDGVNGGLGPHETPLPSADSVEAYLDAAGYPRFVLDLRRVPPGAGPADWLGRSRPFRSIGSLALRCPFGPAVVDDRFDGLIWIDRTSPSELLGR